jgi:hypothetical protein
VVRLLAGVGILICFFFSLVAQSKCTLFVLFHFSVALGFGFTMVAWVNRVSISTWVDGAYGGV